MPQEAVKSASLVVVDPSGHRSTVTIHAQPFRIGRQAGNQVVMRDNRASRVHAEIVIENGEYWLEDLNSRHGTVVNGSRVKRHKLQAEDRVDFGPDSYQLIFMAPGDGVNRLLTHFSANEKGGGKLGKLKAVMEVARALQTSLSSQDVLSAVVDAALAVTGAERGFLLLRHEDELDMKVARDRRGRPLGESDLQVPRRLIHQALHQRRDLLSMSFEAGAGVKAEHTAAALDLRSVVCVPLVRIRVGASQETSMLSAANETLGILYMD